MATLPIAEALVPLEEYLSRCYEPDCEYDDGLIYALLLKTVPYTWPAFR